MFAIGLVARPLMSLAWPVSILVYELALTHLGSGFDYNFNAIQDESNELFSAYKEMFEVAISQGRLLRTIVGIYLPFVNRFLVSFLFFFLPLYCSPDLTLSYSRIK